MRKARKEEVNKMEYGKTMEIGRERAEQAAEIIRRWAAVKACAVCAVKGGRRRDRDERGGWEPVGGRSYKEIARDSGMRGKGDWHLLVVDSSGTAKACTLERFPVGEVLRLADRLPLRVALPGKGELWHKLAEEDYRMYAVYRGRCRYA
jgi:hypothetical protein